VAIAFALALGAAVHAQAPQAVETFDAAWTIIRDTHFDKTMSGLDWDAVRAELRPAAASATTDAALRGIIRNMLGRLGLSHFALIPSSDHEAPGSRRSGGAAPGFDVRLIGQDLVVSRVDRNLAPAVGLGWRLIDIGGTPVARLLRPALEAADGSPQSARLLAVESWRIAQTWLQGPAGSNVDVTFESGEGALTTLRVARHAEQGEPVTVGSLPTMFVRVESERKRTPAGATAGLIRFNVWMAAVDAPFQRAMDEFRGADGIIIDLRGNPGGLAAMLMGISGHFVSERKTLGVMKTRDNELRFPANPRLVNAAGQRVPAYAGPLAILIDGMSGSASECFTGGMQSIGRARVFGETSMGQALPAMFDRLPNGDVLIHATGDFVTADGTRLEGRGVIPDESFPLTREDLLAGRDRPLEAALTWIDRSKATGRPQHR
jgi:carboxyl-terminal processing protease